MVKFIVLVSLVLLCVYLSEETNFLSHDYINTINEVSGTWKAKQFFSPDTPIESIKRLLGAKSFLGPVESLIKRKDSLYVFDIDVPKSFDARTQWRSCKTIRNIPNQGDCGSCWAINAAGAFADRLCIATKGKFNQLISAQEILTCCRTCGRNAGSGGCSGGFPIKAWQFISTSGVVTGGNYNTTDGCQPYKVPPCFINEKRKYQCPRKPTANDLNCTNVCYGNKTIKYEYDHHIATNAYYVTGKNIQKDLLAYGPIEAGFIVYSDFPNYSSGIYKKSFFTRRLGRHAAKLIGWGEEKGVPYWTLINTWGSDWGENGTFRIRRGTNECGIEDEMVAGLP